MKGVTILLTLFIVLTIVFASISTFDYVQLGNQRLGDTTTTSSGETLYTTTTITMFTTTTITTQPPPNQGLIQIAVGGKGFTYTKWNSSTPNTFTISNVKFALLTNATGSYTGASCYGPVGGYEGYVITFPDGSTDRMSACLYMVADTTVILTSHINPQAGILIIPSTGAVYFLVST